MHELEDKMGFKDKPNIRFLSELSHLTNVDYRISILSQYLESHGFLFKILIQMCPLSNDGATVKFLKGPPGD